VRLSKFLAARLPVRGQPHNTHTLDGVLSSRKKDAFWPEAGGAGRVVVSAREPARRTAAASIRLDQSPLWRSQISVKLSASPFTNEA
jgi:hypothetical protein